MEPDVELLGEDGSNIFGCATTHINADVNPEVECLLRNSNNEETKKSTFKCKHIALCKSEPVDNEGSHTKSPGMEIEDDSDKEDLVDLAELKKTLNQNKSTPKCTNIISKHKKLNACRKKPPNVQEISKNANVGENIDISEFLLQSMDTVNVSEEQRTPAVDSHFLLQTETEQLPSNQSSQKKYKCHFCYKSFSFKYSLDEHLLKYHTEEIKDNIDAFITTKTHSCQYCSFKTTRKDNLKVHFNSLHNTQREKINCQFCDKTFLIDKSLDDHILKHHREKMDLVKTKTHKCTICSYQTTCKSLLDSHVRSVHKEQRSQLHCQFCYKSFSFKTSLGDHMLKQHQQEVNGDLKGLITTRIHTCDICSYQSTIKHSLDKHIKLVHNNQRTKMKCKFCDKSFGFKKSLDGHVLKHHKDKINLIKSKIHKCNLCSYITTYKSDLDRHMDSMHNEQRLKVSCEFCSKLFASKPSLDYHLLKKHEAEMVESDKTYLVTSKIHMCKFCIFKTTVRSDLDGHIKSKHKTETNKN